MSDTGDNGQTDKPAEEKAADKKTTTPRVRLRGQPEPKTGAGYSPGQELAPEAAVEADEGTVLMIFPKEVMLTDDAHKRIKFPQGIVKVPAHIADHWYLEACGATKAEAQQVQVPQEVKESE